MQPSQRSGGPSETSSLGSLGVGPFKTCQGQPPWPSGQVRIFCFCGPGFPQLGSWVRTRHHSSGHAESASHIAQAEGPTTRMYNYVLGGFGEKKEKKKRWATELAQVLIFKKKRTCRKWSLKIYSHRSLDLVWSLPSDQSPHLHTPLS